MDWSKIRAEYIEGGISYRKLAEKYGVPFSNLKRLAKKEGWVSLRSQSEHKATTKVVSDIGKRKGSHSSNVFKVADKLLQKIEDMVETMPVLDTQSVKQLTSALKDLRDIKGIKTAIDLKEQEARIAKLEKEAAGQEAEKHEVSIIIEGGDESWRS